MEESHGVSIDLARKTQITVIDTMASDAEQSARRQAHSEEWFKYRAGRVTACIMKAACSTDPQNLSLSLLKRISYPTQFPLQIKATTDECLLELPLKGGLSRGLYLCICPCTSLSPF